MNDRNLTPGRPIEFFVSGTTRGHPKANAIVRYRKIAKGWESRVVEGKAPNLNNVYASDETREDLAGWHSCDFAGRVHVTETLSEARERASTTCDRA